ncbi:MAG: iron ABC transporter permease [Methanomassiliicoccales archaeon]
MILVMGISLSLGSANISFTEAYAAVLNKFFPGLFEVSNLADTVVWNLRLPRSLLASIAGFILAMAGCTTIATLRNPLATPYTLGVSAGAGFGAAGAIILGRGLFMGHLIIVGNAFVFSLIPACVVLLISRYPGMTPETIILSGVAMTYIFSACNTLLQFFAEAEAVKTTVFWLVGDLSRAAWWQIPYATSMLIFSMIINMRFAWDINIMETGDDAAKGLGVEVNRVRKIILVTSCLSTATVVSFVGAIGFVCLLSPHICRIVIGNDMRFLIPISGLFGANLLLVADILARRIIAPVMLPVGAITALLGGRLLIDLIVSRAKKACCG